MTTVQATVVVAVNQVIWLIAGFGIVDNQTAGKFVALSGTIVSLAFLVAHAVERHGAARVAAAKAAASASPDKVRPAS